MTEIGKKGKITNDEVEKLLHISDKTAERYLLQPVKEQKIKTNGQKGKALLYAEAPSFAKATAGQALFRITTTTVQKRLAQR